MGRARLSAQKRFESLSRSVQLEVDISLATAVRLRSYAAAQGLSVEEAVSDAIQWWGIRQERHAAMRRRIAVDRVMREAMEWDPIGDVLAAAWKAGLDEESPDGLRVAD